MDENERLWPKLRTQANPDKSACVIKGVFFIVINQNYVASMVNLKYNCISGSGDEGSDQEREWEEQQILKGVTGIQQVNTGL